MFMNYPNTYSSLLYGLYLNRDVELNKEMKLREPWHIDTFTAFCSTETKSK